MPKTQTGGAQTAITVTIDASKPKRWQPPAGPGYIAFYDRSTGKPRITLMVDQHEIPYIDVVDITERWKDYVPEPDDKYGSTSFRFVRAIENGERIFNLTLDDRYGHTVTESELWNWATFLANAMAVSAGYTSHGQNSRRINRHGISL